MPKPGTPGSACPWTSAAAPSPPCASMPPRFAGDVDLRFHRQADAQRILGELARIERDAHRHPLNNLDPVAGRILRGDQCESRAGAAGHADDAAAEGDFVA